MTPEQAATLARERGAHPHIVRGAVTGKRAALEAIADALSFPDWFGHNLDALYDSLTDLSWLEPGEHVLIVPRLDPGVESVLQDAELCSAQLGERVLKVVHTS